MKEQIADLLIQGIPHGIVAETVGCDPSYVTQVSQEEVIAQQIAEARAKRASKMVKHDNVIHEIEDIALDRIKRMLPNVSDIMKVTRVFDVMNKARRAGDHGMQGQSVQADEVIALRLPTTAKFKLTMTTDRQIIEVEGRSMVPLPSAVVAQKLRDAKAKRLLDTIDMPSKLISEEIKQLVNQL